MRIDCDEYDTQGLSPNGLRNRRVTGSVPTEIKGEERRVCPCKLPAQGLSLSLGKCWRIDTHIRELCYNSAS